MSRRSGFEVAIGGNLTIRIRGNQLFSRKFSNVEITAFDNGVVLIKDDKPFPVIYFSGKATLAHLTTVHVKNPVRRRKILRKIMKAEV